MKVDITKYWIEGVLTDKYPNFARDKGADLDSNGKIEGSEVFKSDYQAYLQKNRAQLSANIPFFAWGEKLSVGNRIHRLMYLLSDLHTDTQMQSAYLFIESMVSATDQSLQRFPRPTVSFIEMQAYYKSMTEAGITFEATKSTSMVDDIEKQQLDCDTSSFVAMAIGDERGVSLHPTLAPRHVFLRDTSYETDINFDFGEMKFDQFYYDRLHVDSAAVDHQAYLYTLNAEQVEGLFLHHRAMILDSSGHYEEELASLDKAIQRNPNFSMAYIWHGAALLKLGRTEEALVSFNRALFLDPSDPIAYYDQGNSLLKLQRYEEAAHSYNKATELDPQLAEAYYNLGNILHRLGRHGEANIAQKKALQLKPELLNEFQRFLLWLSDLL